MVFRNSGFTPATLIASLALTALPYVSAALGVGAALFGLVVTLACRVHAPPRAVVAADSAVPTTGEHGGGA